MVVYVYVLRTWPLIRKPKGGDLGTAFKPSKGYFYRYLTVHTVEIVWAGTEMDGTLTSAFSLIEKIGQDHVATSGSNTQMIQILR